MIGPQIAWLPDGRRLHLNHGPIDLIIEAFGDEAECRAAYEQAIGRFDTVLTGLVEELAELRRPASATPRVFHGSIARRMEHAACRHTPPFITPMAAVAGAVADEMLEAMCAGRRLDKAYVNDGGDIAIHLAESTSIKTAIAGTGHGFADRIVIGFADPVRGIATSGWRGRSHSLGIADAVTVLAKTAAEADAAATLIANAVDLLFHPAVRRVPACELAPDSDLGDRLVTVDVGPLAPGEIAEALGRGLALAEEFRRNGLIEAAALFLGGDMRISGTVAFDDTPFCPAGPNRPLLTPSREEITQQHVLSSISRAGKSHMARPTPSPARCTRYLSPSKGERMGGSVADSASSPPSSRERWCAHAVPLLSKGEIYGQDRGGVKRYRPLTAPDDISKELPNA